MNKKKIIIIITLLLVLSLGITLAWWRWQSTTNTNVTFTVEGVTITYDAGPDISNIKLIPVSSKEKGETDGTGIAKTITASANKTSYLTLNLDLVTFPSNLADASLVWEIYKGNTKVGNGNFANKAQGDSITLFTNQEINSTTSTYKLYIWIDGNQENPSAMMNQSFVFHLNANATDEAPGSVLPDFILNSNAPLDSVNSTYVTGYYESYTVRNEDKATLKAFIMNDGMDSETADQCIANDSECLAYYVEDYNQSNDPDIELIGVGPISGINFKENSSDTNGKGLYIRSGTENNINPIYYYRGAVENNNVYFANYCWKIVRTTDTGGLKMIYNDVPTSGSCGFGVESQSFSTIGNSAFNTNNNDAKYVGYTYDNNNVETDSTIKGVIDTWYQTNILANYDNYIEDTVYCNDREEASASERTQFENLWGYTYDSSVKIYKPSVRFRITEVPSLECTNNADKYTKSSSIGNGKLQYPVGLLTMDEIWLAGMRTSGTNNYLKNNFSWWSLSPGGFEGGVAFVMIADPNFGLDEYHDNVRARPALSLKPEYNTFTYGNGTTDNPYRFEEYVTSTDVG